MKDANDVYGTKRYNVTFDKWLNTLSPMALKEVSKELEAKLLKLAELVSKDAYCAGYDEGYNVGYHVGHGDALNERKLWR